MGHRRLSESRLILASLFAFAGLFAAGVPSAGAAVTIGQTVTPNSLCGGDTFFQKASLAQQYSAPSAGVITSWAFQGDAAPPPVRFKVGRPLGGNQYTVVGASDTVNPAANTLNSYPTRISVKAGDQIGFFTGTGNCAFEIAPTGNLIVYFTADLNPGATETFAQQDERLLNVSAKLEPDADNDGWGDETQDKCIGTTGAYNGCPSTIQIRKVKQKSDTKVAVAVKVPGAGTVAVGSPSDPALASASAKSLKAVTRTLTGTTEQKTKLVVKLTKSAIRTLTRSGKLKLKVKAVYTPPGGPPGSAIKKKKLKT